MRALGALVLLVSLSGCGGARAPGATSSNEARSGELEPAAATPAPVVTSCTPEGSPLRFELLDLPPSIVVAAYDRRTCVLVPADADEPPWAFFASLNARETSPDERGAVEERIHDDDAPVMGRGEIELLGAPRRYVAYGGEQLFVGEGEARYTLVDLRRHTIDVAVVFRTGTPEPVRAELLAALARMRVVGLEHATDARVFDPSVAVCEADGLPLIVPVPEGGAHQESWPSQCMIAPDANPELAAWSVWIGSIAASDAGPEQLLAREPDGARAWAEAALSEPRFLEEGTVSFLGEPTRWYAFEARMGESAPLRRMTIARVRRGDRHVVAVLSTGDAAQSAPLLEALAGAREP